MAIIRIPLHSRKYPGLFAIIDEEDADLVLPYRWNVLLPSRSRTFYACRGDYSQTGPRGGKKRLIYMHREINQTPNGFLTDHINGDGLDNRRENLRSVTQSVNLANSQTPIINKSGYIGVYEQKGRQTRIYDVVVQGERIGSFANAEEAARVADRARVELWGRNIRLNFPDEWK